VKFRRTFPSKPKDFVILGTNLLENQNNVKKHSNYARGLIQENARFAVQKNLSLSQRSMWRSQENMLLILDIIDVKDVVQNENKTFDKNYQEI